MGRSQAGNRKDTSRRTFEGDHPPNSFEDLLESLEGMRVAEPRTDASAEHRELVVSTLRPWRKRALRLLGSDRPRHLHRNRWRRNLGDPSRMFLADRNVIQPAAAANADISPSPALSVPHVSPAASEQVSQSKNHSVKVRFSGSGNPSEGPAPGSRRN